MAASAKTCTSCLKGNARSWEKWALFNNALKPSLFKKSTRMTNALLMRKSIFRNSNGDIVWKRNMGVVVLLASPQTTGIHASQEQEVVKMDQVNVHMQIKNAKLKEIWNVSNTLQIKSLSIQQLIKMTIHQKQKNDMFKMKIKLRVEIAQLFAKLSRNYFLTKNVAHLCG